MPNKSSSLSSPKSDAIAPDDLVQVGDGVLQSFTSLSTQQQNAWKSQERYLEQMARTRTHSHAAQYAGIHRDTAHKWRQNDYLGFVSRLATAEATFCDMLEGHALDTALATKPGQSPILLITLLNANLPEKYRQATGLSEDTAKQLLRKYKQGKGKVAEEEQG